MLMKTKVILASNNQGKIKEINTLLAVTSLKVVAQSVYAIWDVEETGLTFVENAILKARHACLHSGLAAIADDSGLEVDYLQGEPGIYSARYAGNDKNDKANIEKLLYKLEGVPEENRTARFRCVIVYMRHAYDPAPIICQGIWEGRIAFEAKGENGFGYDPIFYVPDQQCHAAELVSDVKNSISHRAKALQQLLALITK